MSKIKDTLKKHRKDLLKKKGVVGVAIGKKIKGGKKTQKQSIVCFVIKKKAQSSIKKADLVPQTLDGITTDVVESGEIKALAIDPKARTRPAPGGVSVGHFNITAGTLGMWVLRDGKYHILSNNHVLANENESSLGDAILQPGPYDSGVNSKDKIAELADFVPVDFENDNLVDAALAVALGQDGTLPPPDGEPSWCPIANSIANVANAASSTLGRKTRLIPVVSQGVEEYVLPEIANIGRPTGFAEGFVGMKVRKMGRTTDLTLGKILYSDAAVLVSYSSGSAYFIDQFIMGNMSAGGDSGSVVLTDDGKDVVGLLFAGSDVFTIVNRIQNVLDAFPGISLP